MGLPDGATPVRQGAVIHCHYDEMVDPAKLKPNPVNRNSHGEDQIERLAYLFGVHGIRHPIIVSKRSGLIVAGHGRRIAAIRAGFKDYPVVYQDFDSDEKEYAFVQADNAIALWAELDLSGINGDLPDLGPDFDVDWLGIKNFTLDPSEKDEEDKPQMKSMTFLTCPHCNEEFEQSQALKRVE